MNFSRTILAGNLANDPEMKSAKGTTITKFTLAVNRKYKDKESTAFIPCKAFGGLAETLAKYLTKGKPVFVVGELDENRWEHEGKNYSRLELIINEFQFVPDGRRREESQTGNIPF